jgi:hypothetical protein
MVVVEVGGREVFKKERGLGDVKCWREKREVVGCRRSGGT